MTWLLKDVMTERANAVEAPALDFDGIIRAGDRRIHRRRVAGTVLAAAACIALLSTAWVVLDRPSTVVTPAEPPGFTERRTTYGLGNRIVYGQQVIDLGERRMVVFVQTDNGFVFTDRSNEVYLADGKQVTRIGTGNWSYELAADDGGGSLVAWIQELGGVAYLVVYDTAKRSEVGRVVAPVRPSGGPSPTITSTTGPLPHRSSPVAQAIDGSTVYFHADDETRRWSPGMATSESIDASGDNGWLKDAGAGRLAFGREEGGIVVSADPRARQPDFGRGNSADLSPLGTRLCIHGEDTARCFDVRSGAKLPIRHPEHQYVAVSQWIDEDTAVMIGLKDADTPFDLIRCSLTSGRCDVVVRGFAADDDFQLPTGRDVDDL